MRLLLDTSGYSAFKRGQPEVVELLPTASGTSGTRRRRRG
jgi:hypothetical protein